MDAKKIWSYARRLLAIIPSIFICALGVALLVWPEWGCDPLTTFEIGLSNVFHVQFGTVALVFEGIMFFVFFFVRRDLVHLGIAVTGSNGTYTVDPEQVGDNKMYDMESIGDGTTVGTGMNLKLNGLAEGSYWLVETQAPDGYNKLTAPVKITITKSDTTNVNDWTIKQNDGVVDDKIIDIENTTGTLLPETGGMGTVIFTVIAVVMILGIAVSFVISRRKRA